MSPLKPKIHYIYIIRFSLRLKKLQFCHCGTKSLYSFLAACFRNCSEKLCERQ